MTFTELKSTITSLIGKADYPAIATLITPENVAISVTCVGKSVNDDIIQPLTRPDQLHDDYLQLLTDLAAAGNADTIVANYFVPVNILLADFGNEYQSALTIATDAYTELGYGDPTGEAENRIATDMDRLAILENAQIPSTC